MTRNLSGQVAETLLAASGDFVSAPVAEFELALEGVVGDRQHFGFTRKSGGREPWHPRGTPIANDRQVSIVSGVELAMAAERMGIAGIEPGWIGANLAIDGIKRLSFLPRGTRLMFPSGATLFVTDQNAPCRLSGAAIARHVPGSKGLELTFPKAAQGLRGVVAMVERAGRIQAGDTVRAVIPAREWIYADMLAQPE